jgi:hypothetical protein
MLDQHACPLNSVARRRKAIIVTSGRVILLQRQAQEGTRYVERNNLLAKREHGRF